MRKIFIVCLFSLFGVCGLRAAEEHDQQAVTLMNSGDWFGLKDYLDENRDRLNDYVGTFASAFVNTYFNEPYEAINDWNQVLGYAEQMADSANIKASCFFLMKLYEEVQDYEQAMAACDKMLAMGDLDPQEAAALTSKKEFMAKYAGSPMTAVAVSSPDAEATLALSHNPDDLFSYFSAEMEWNGRSVVTAFDTGARNTVMPKAVADMIGVKYLSGDTIQNSGLNQINVMSALVDSLSLGGITIYNIPVLVITDTMDEQLRFLPDTTQLYEEIKGGAEKKMNNIILGMPFMKLFEEIEFDRNDNTVTFSLNSPQLAGTQGSPLCFVDNIVYMKCKLNGLDFVCDVDTGFSGKGDPLIYNDYYQKYKDTFPLKSSDTHPRRSLFLGNFFEVQCYDAEPVRIEIGGKTVELPHPDIFTDDANNNNFRQQVDLNPVSNGFLGITPFQEADKVIFNFDDMWCRLE